MGLAVACAIHISDRGDVVMDRLNVHGFQEADASPLTQISLSFPVRRGGVGRLSINYLPPQKISTWCRSTASGLGAQPGQQIVQNTCLMAELVIGYWRRADHKQQTTSDRRDSAPQHI